MRSLAPKSVWLPQAAYRTLQIFDLGTTINRQYVILSHINRAFPTNRCGQVGPSFRMPESVVGKAPEVSTATLTNVELLDAVRAPEVAAVAPIMPTRLITPVSTDEAGANTWSHNPVAWRSRRRLMRLTASSHREIVHLMQATYADQRRGNTPVSNPTSDTVRESAGCRGVAAESVGRKLHQIRELPCLKCRKLLLCKDIRTNCSGTRRP